MSNKSNNGDGVKDLLEDPQEASSQTMAVERTLESSDWE